MEWKNININLSNVITQTDKATLIKLPNKSKYAGYSFWHSNKLIRDGINSNAICISYNNEFEFKFKKYGNGKYNKTTLLVEVKATIDEFEECFGTMNENIRAKIEKKPPVLSGGEVTIIDDLRDD
ncbi:MAG: hypothetical protein RR712_03370 [Terrisporobacter sp.]